MRPASSPVRASNALTTVAPSSSTATGRRLPPNVPTGVRTGLTIAAPLIASPRSAVKLGLLSRVPAAARVVQPEALVLEPGERPSVGRRVRRLEPVLDGKLAAMTPCVNRALTRPCPIRVLAEDR